ncbi:MAG: GTPase [Planctomycetaceae bacterium]
MNAGPPRACILTPPGRGAVATIRIVGGDSVIDAAQPRVFRAVNGRDLCDQELQRIVFGRWGLGVTEDVVVCRLRSEVTEIHCHGGDSAVHRVMADLERLGCQSELWRTHLTGQVGFLEAELQDALQRAPTLRTAALLVQQVDGRLEREIVKLMSDIESEAAAGAAANSDRVLVRLQSLVTGSGFGRHLIQPWRVVFAGRPNVGKSSLINVLLGFTRSIVFDEPGTTRDAVASESAFDGWPVRLIDTAGLRPTTDDLERAGMDKTRAELATASCRVVVLDVSRAPTEQDVSLFETWPDALIVAHKADRPVVWGKELPHNALSVSSLDATGIDTLERAIVDLLVPETPNTEAILAVTERQVACLEQARQFFERGEYGAARDELARLLHGDAGDEGAADSVSDASLYD